MGFFKELKQSWKEKSTGEKIGMCIDAVCGCAATFIGKRVGDILCEGNGSKAQRFCIRTASYGMAYAATDAAAKSLRKNGGDAAGLLIDAARGKAKITKVSPTENAGIKFEYEEER